jgi:DNA-directed RNA polymerase sigma subunit (sigma70/sigma32)
MSSGEYLNNRTFEAIIDAFQTFKKHKTRCELVLKDLQETHERRCRKYNDDKKQEAVKIHMTKYDEVCKSYKAYQEQLAYAFYILSENIANYARFNGIDVDDAIQEGVLICFEKIDRFDPRKGKAFNYMTTCILNHYRQIYRSIRNYNELKKRYGNHLQDKFEKIFFRGRVTSRSSFDADSHLDSGN